MASSTDHFVPTIEKDTFFNDPFFEDWWKDFDSPFKLWNKQFNRQISGSFRKSLLDNIFELKEHSGNFPQTSQEESNIFSNIGSKTYFGSSQVIKDGKFVLEVDIQDFDPEDIEVTVKQSKCLVKGKREVKRGSAISFREFTRSYDIPHGVDVDNLHSEVSSEGKLIITAPHKSISVESQSDAFIPLKMYDDIFTTKVGAHSSAGISLASNVSKESSAKSTTGDVIIPIKIEGADATEKSNVMLPEMTSSTASKQKIQGDSVMYKATSYLNKQIPIKICSTGKIVEKKVAPKERVMPITEEGGIESILESLIEEVKSGKENKEEILIKKAAETVSQHMEKMKEIKEMKATSKKTLKADASIETEEFEDFYIPLKHIKQVDQSALSEATALAKMRDNYFELVVNIKQFNPEDVKVHTEGQSVIIEAKHESWEDNTTQNFYQKIMLPIDVDVEKLTSGISHDRILLIKVPKRSEKEFKIPIISETLVSKETAATSLSEQDQKMFVPIQRQGSVQDERKAIERMTIGVAEVAGAEAGMEAAIVTAEATLKVAVEKAILNVSQELAVEIPKEIGNEIINQFVREKGAMAGKTAGCEAGLRAGTEELAKENLEGVALEQISTLHEKYEKVGANAGKIAGTEAGSKIDVTDAVEMATKAARCAAEKAENEVKGLKQYTIGAAEESGADAGENSGSVSGAKSGENIAMEAVLDIVARLGSEIGGKISGEFGSNVGREAALKIGEEIAKNGGRELGAEAGRKVGRLAGARAAADAAVEQSIQDGIKNVDIDKLPEYKLKYQDIGTEIGELAGSKSGHDAGLTIDVSLVVSDAVEAAKIAATNAAKDALNIEKLAMEIGEEAGAVAGENAGKNAGAEGAENFIKDKIATAAAIAGANIGKELFGKTGEELGKNIGMKVGIEEGIKAARAAGSKLGTSAGKEAGSTAGLEGALSAARNFNLAQIGEDWTDKISKIFTEVAQDTGNASGAKAGYESGLLIDAKAIIKSAEEAAIKATKSLVEEVKDLQKLAEETAGDAGSITGEEFGAKIASEEAVNVVLPIAIEAAEKLGNDLFGKEGEKIAKATAEKVAKHLAKVVGKEIGAKEGKLAGRLAGVEAASMAADAFNLKALTKEEIAINFGELGFSTGEKAGISAGKLAASKIDVSSLVSQAVDAAKKAVELAIITEKAKAKELEKEELFKAIEEMAIDIANETGAKVGEETGRLTGEEVGKIIGEKTGMEIGEKIGLAYKNENERSIATAVAIAAGKKFGAKVGLEEGSKAGIDTGRKEGVIAAISEIKKELQNIDKEAINKDKIDELKKVFVAIATKSAKEAAISKSTVAAEKAAKEAVENFILDDVKKVADKAVASELERSSLLKEIDEIKENLSLEIGGKCGEEAGMQAGMIAGEISGGEVGAELGAKLAMETENEKIIKTATKAGKKFGNKVGKEAGKTAGAAVGKLAGIEAARKVISEEIANTDLKQITRDKVRLLQKLFSDLATLAAKDAGAIAGKEAGKKAGAEAALKFEGAKNSTEKAIDKAKEAEIKKIEKEADNLGGESGLKAGADAGADVGEKVGGDIGEEEGRKAGEKIGREIAGEEGAKLGAEVGAAAGKKVGLRLGKKIGRKAGEIEGKKAGSKAAVEAWQKEVKVVISKDRVTALRIFFGDVGLKAGIEAGKKAAKDAVNKGLLEEAAEAGEKAAREAVLAACAKKTFQMSADWKPTCLIAVIAARKDLSPKDQLRMAARSKMDGIRTVRDLVDQKYSTSLALRGADPAGKLKFQAEENPVNEAESNVNTSKKWSTVVFSDLPDDEEKPEKNISKEKVSSLAKRFETKDLKKNETYVIM